MPQRCKTIYLLAASLLLIGPSGCRKEQGGAAQANQPARPVPVKVAPLERGALRLSLRYPGELQAPETVEMASEVGGRIEAVTVRMGDRVAQGQLLLRVDDTQLRSQLAEARAALEVARSALKRAAVEERNSAAELERKAPLAQRELVTRQEMDNVTAQRDSAAASLAVARAQVTQSAARLELLQKQLKDTRIRAPFAGWVQRRHLDAGAVVSPGTAVLRLVRTDPAVARFQVGERHIGEIRRLLAGGELPVQISVDAYPGEVFPGKVARVAPALDSASRTVAVEAELANEDGRLMPGMFCRVEIELGTRQDALLLPLTALLEQGGEAGGPSGALAPRQQAQVYVIDGQLARRTAITLGVDDGAQGEVLDGLHAGHQVVVEGQQALADGKPVQVVGAAR